MEMMKKLAVLSAMSKSDCDELDRLQRAVWDAESELEFMTSSVDAGEALQDELIDSKRICDKQKSNLNKFKQEMLEKYVVTQVYGEYMWDEELGFTD
jgi:hypothetical protein